jgi:molecular chaperone DnaJ
MADHYETLGVSRTATPEEIKKAYRRLAREYHPDANPGDPEAAERFKRISHAYEVLSSPEKRSRYDTFGDERVGAEQFSDFGGISDLFATFFGGGVGGRATQQRGPARGADVLAEVELTLEEAAAGVERDVDLGTLTRCPDCDGSGAAPGTSPVRCADCDGTGEYRQVRRTVFGNMMTATTCPTCGGEGMQILDPCRNCRGTGRVQVTETLTVQIPPGVDDGAQLRVTGRGHSGLRGGRSGDLYVAIRVLPHETFRRAGDDLGREVAVPMTVAALGGEIVVPTLDDVVPVEVSPGTQSGEVKTIKGKGMPRLNGRGNGDLVVLLKVETPTGLTTEQAQLLEQLAELRDEHPEGVKGFLEKIKGAFS